jgi:peptide-methionine (R)-S-oxide reductase
MSSEKELSDKEREVIEQCGTEPRFSSDLLDIDEEGFFKCKKCGQELFTSETKYESGSGWPSFWDAKNESVEKRTDTSHGMERTEVVCSNCKAHLGHVFEDGPQDKTGKRYCINGIALEFDED